MPNTVDFSGKPFHFIGIGGIGMSALAYVLAKRQIPVSGSDLRRSHITERLESVGVHFFGNQEATNLEFFRSKADSAYQGMMPEIGRDVGDQVATSKSNSSLANDSPSLPQVICSTAINQVNSEYLAALERGYPIFHRSELLAALIQDYQSIAVAGTHGKTTTSSLIGYLLLKAGLDPTIVVGGEVDAWDGNARLGNGPILVAEADESDGSLAKLSAKIGVITNIELDHPDHYQNLQEVIEIFQTFAKRCQIVIGCLDCETLRSALCGSASLSHLQPNITYSLHRDTGADYSVDQVTYHADGTIAQVWEKEQLLGELHLKLLGTHNLSNALAAVAVGRNLGLDFEVIQAALATFEGAKRRFELRGNYDNIAFIDDYAHHPSELQVTLAAARLRVTAPHRLVAIFQPHRYSRTKTFLQEFAKSFNDADLVLITDIYSAGEPNLEGMTGATLQEAIAVHHHQVYYQPLESVTEFLTKNLQPGDFVIFLGAGNLNQLIPQVMDFYKQKELSSKA